MRHSDGSMKVLLPDGHVTRFGVVSISENWEAVVRYFVYSVHRYFRNLNTSTTLGRLHLASLYASCACNIPDRRYNKPATVIATQLVRSCWQNEPFTADEQSKLLEVSGHGALSCPTLSLVCASVLLCSNNVRFLYGREIGCNDNNLPIDPLAVDDYNCHGYAPRLEPFEEFILFGKRQQKVDEMALAEQKSHVLEFVQMQEKTMLKEVLTELPNQKDKMGRAFPLSSRGVGKELFAELEESHRCYLGTQEFRLNSDYKEEATKRLQHVQSRRLETQNMIRREVQPSDMRSTLRLGICSGKVATMSLLDMVRLIYDSRTLDQFLPDAKPSQRKKVSLHCLDWCALYVLEHRLQRIIEVDGKSDPQLLLSEATCVRRWNPLEYPRWMAFEIEQGLQIRPDQYATVSRLLQTPGGMIQLNMGLGA